LNRCWCQLEANGLMVLHGTLPTNLSNKAYLHKDMIDNKLV